MAVNEIRRSQAIYAYAPGAIGDFPELSLMILTHDNEVDDWGEESHDDPSLERQIIEDERLGDAFNVDRFVLPPVSTQQKRFGVCGIRFPVSMYCPKCGRIHFEPQLMKYYGPGGYIPNVRGNKTFNQQQQAYYCSDCIQRRQYNKLIPTRFVIATEDGFIDDFPWDWFVHIAAPEERGKGHKLYLEFSGSTASLSGIKVISRDRSGHDIVSRKMGEIADENFLCENDYLEYVGYRMAKPWLTDLSKGRSFYTEEIKVPHDKNHELTRRKYPRVLQRGAGNLYFPIIFSALRLPRVKPHFNHVILNNIDSVVKTLCGFIKEERDWRKYFLEEEGFKGLCERNCNVSAEDLKQYVKLYFDGPIENRSGTLRWDEFQYYTDSGITQVDRLYKAVHIDGRHFQTNHLLKNGIIRQVVILEKLTVLNIFKGFTRLRPLMVDDLAFVEGVGLSGARLEEYKRIQRPCKSVSTKELPCSENRGEGIFIRFDDEKLFAWEHSALVERRVKMLNDNLENYAAQFGLSLPVVSARYVLLHTLSHMLMNEMAYDCGYNVASLSELIYCGDESEQVMNGILIYTSSPDADGTMGGLAENGRPEYLPGLIAKAYDRAKWCSSDPLCIESGGQGFMGLNLAACHSCLVLPETCCENMNRYLDRALVVGGLHKDELPGFFDVIRQL